MAFGMGSVTADAGAVSGVHLILSIAEMLTNREEVAAQIREWNEARGKAERAIAELKKREQQVLHREQEAAKLEQVLQQRLEAVGEREQQAEAAVRRAEEANEHLAALKADLKMKMAA
jgi:hypothetical protein